MKEKLVKIRQSALDAIQGCTKIDGLLHLETQFLGRKSELSNQMRLVKDQPVSERPALGALANSIRQEINQALVAKKQSLNQVSTPKFDIDHTLPSIKPVVGHLHPITIFMDRIIEIYRSMGFDVAEGTEVETAEYNFDKLNIPKDHPARDMWDTFYLKTAGKSGNDELLMRTHTSPVQLRYMEHSRPPVRLIVPGRVFRHEATDASHESTFYQCEGLVIDRGISLAHLIGTLKSFLRELYEADVVIRVRPEFYPFVEPGLDIDLRCLLCGGKGCPVCKQTGWIELIGSGMVHPAVLHNMKLDPKVYSGFAFGMGVDRLMLLYYGIPDIRLLYAGDLRFNSQWT
ncbi:MAG: phenylalanine--tRNA ligase subunit alpha [Patescibacteria group bacterium]|jgi:phenylalanyl-tRNA synthetase alpha chain